MPPKLLYIQNSVHLAGAQKCLSRLLVSEGLHDHAPCLLSKKKGWLTDACVDAGVDFFTLPFPSSRSLQAKLWKNKSFGRRVVANLRKHFPNQTDWIVHSNDHPDSLLGLAVARELNAPSVITLRTPTMSQRDFQKYQCGKHQHVTAVGNKLYDRVSEWLSSSRLTLVYDGISDDEIIQMPPTSLARVDKIVVLGSISPRKGWQDLIEALLLIESTLPNEPLPEFHFLGDCGAPNELQRLLPKIVELKRIEVKFIGVTENYREHLVKYSLALHPSRSESFGMAALECVATGVPLIAGETGMIPNFIPNREFLHKTSKPKDLANKLLPLIKKSPKDLYESFNFPVALEAIRSSFSTRSTIKKLKGIYSNLS